MMNIIEFIAKFQLELLKDRYKYEKFIESAYISNETRLRNLILGTSTLLVTN